MEGWDHLLQPKDRGAVGFRDFRLFNQALLSRQAWRLIANPNSLCAQVLKSRYYPNGKLEDTVFSGNASSSWQAISHGLDLLKKGLLWRVDNGNPSHSKGRAVSVLLLIDLVAKTVTNSIKRPLVYTDKIVKGNTEMRYIHNGYLILDDRK